MGRKEKKEKDAERSPTCYKMEEEGEKVSLLFPAREREEPFYSFHFLFVSFDRVGRGETGRGRDKDPN